MPKAFDSIQSPLQEGEIWSMYLKSVNITRYLRECSTVCIHVFTLHDQILERQLESDKVSVVKCGSLHNKTYKKVVACLTHVWGFLSVAHIWRYSFQLTCVWINWVCDCDCVNTRNLCSRRWIPGYVWIWLFSILLSCLLLLRTQASICVCFKVYLSMCVHLSVCKYMWEVDWYIGLIFSY